MRDPINVHGTAVVLDQVGVLLRGPSGSGKSLLALALLDRWQEHGRPAFLVSDDRVDLVQDGDGLLMQVPTALAGLIELRGRGIVQCPHASPARLHLLVDLVPDLIRMPDDDAFRASLAGLVLARAPVPVVPVVSMGHQVLLVVHAIQALTPP